MKRSIVSFKRAVVGLLSVVFVHYAWVLWSEWMLRDTTTIASHN